MKTIVSIIVVLLLFVNNTFCQETEESKKASEQYQDFVEDMFDDDDDDDMNETNTNNPSEKIRLPDELELLNFRAALRNLGGSFGTWYRTLEMSYMNTKQGCSQTYSCMFNFLLKLETVVMFESKLRENLSCKDKQKVIEDYILFFGVMNLDIYCVDHLHPDNNELSDEELVDIMLVMGKANNATLGTYLDFKSYKDIKDQVQPYCTNDLEEECSCGEFIGTMDQNEKDKVIKDIRVLIDAVNPFWQAQKALQLNQELQTITPCSK